MPARIVFAGGTELTVAEPAKEVQQALSQDRSRGELFSRFGAYGAELELFVAGDQVAYVQEIPARES
jgi:hypothetical protein